MSFDETKLMPRSLSQMDGPLAALKIYKAINASKIQIIYMA